MRALRVGTLQWVLEACGTVMGAIGRAVEHLAREAYVRVLRRVATEAGYASPRFRETPTQPDETPGEREPSDDAHFRPVRGLAAHDEAQHSPFQAILESSALGLMFVEAESGRIVANPMAVETFGRPLAPDTGPAQYLAQVRKPSGQPLMLEELPSSRALRGETVQDEELVNLSPDGRQTPILASAAPVRGRDGAVTGAVVLLQDISAIKELERLREEWTSIIAHDLRQPVTVITGYASLLSRLARARRRSRQETAALEHILASAHQLNRMIADLLDISRLEAGRLRLELQAVDLPALVHEVVERTAEATSGHPVRLELKGSLPLIEVDPGRIEQVLGNLLANAAKYGYAETEIRVVLDGRAEEVEVAVANYGPAIPPEELSQLFTRFHRGRQAEEQRVGGLGLGLYISKGLVEAHGGRMWAESPPEETTIFHFTLPRRDHSCSRGSSV